MNDSLWLGSDNLAFKFVTFLFSTISEVTIKQLRDRIKECEEKAEEVAEVSELKMEIIFNIPFKSDLIPLYSL